MTAPDAKSVDAEILDALPYGVLALTPDGIVIRANAAAQALLPGLEIAADRSCDLFSCQAPGGPCDRGCFVARVAGSSRPTPEIRIDTVGGTSSGALWVTASPMASGRGAILHLRSARRYDRRRRSEERWQTGPELRIHVLGRTHVEAREDPLDTDWLGQRPGQILKYLVCERARVVMVDEIAESVWPNDGSRAIAKARYAIHQLRAKLEPRRAAHAAPKFVVTRSSGYALDRERIWIDADEFERAVEEGGSAMARLDSTSATHHLERASELYRGEFLSDEPYTHWADAERHRLAGKAIHALQLLTALAREAGDDLAAISHLKRVAELEPLDTRVHRELVQALLADGLHSDAKRHYGVFARRVRRELGEEPGFDLRSLSR